MKITRRTFVERALKSSALTLSYKLGAATVLLTPAQARAQEVPLQTLNEAQVAIIDILAETILPGGSEAGVAQFIDHQLNEDPNEALLLAKYFQAPLPYSDFYAGGLNAASVMAERDFGKPIVELDATESENLVRAMSAPGAAVDGYPVSLFYICIRSDTVDVVYGTPEGFKKLNVPYMEHILPPEGWNG